jgi:hypothetical protein
MVASGDRINYSLRPAKAVERKMLKDIFFLMSPFGYISECKYIGFGSKYFSDFKLFHKALHINDMVSIEGDVLAKGKYEFNKPFGCVKLEMGTSNNVLNRLEIDKKFIAWLDYDYPINKPMLSDIEVLIENLYSGSVILTSFNAMPPKLMQLREELKDNSSTHPEMVRKKLESLILSPYIPRNLPKKGIAKSAVYSKIIREIFVNKIQHSLLDKNAALVQEDKWVCKQIVYFNYKDGADMSTLGWVFYQEKDSERYENCNFSQLEFYRDGAEACHINVPNLTLKEVRHLQEAMPLGSGEIDRSRFLKEIYSDEDISSFSKIYKYFPSFTDVEIA